ncbi:hypothetical protein ABZP36_004488 [Zizania latifolia]
MESPHDVEPQGEMAASKDVAALLHEILLRPRREGEEPELPDEQLRSNKTRYMCTAKFLMVSKYLQNYSRVIMVNRTLNLQDMAMVSKEGQWDTEMDYQHDWSDLPLDILHEIWAIQPIKSLIHTRDVERRHIGEKRVTPEEKLIYLQDHAKVRQLSNGDFARRINMANEISSIKEVLRSSAVCPHCGTAISRVDGCNHMMGNNDNMFCSECQVHYCAQCSMVVRKRGRARSIMVVADASNTVSTPRSLRFKAQKNDDFWFRTLLRLSIGGASVSTMVNGVLLSRAVASLHAHAIIYSP